MDGRFEVSDPTDWLGTSLQLVAPLESALRCQVCKDFFKTPMITSCSHTFCSICIRRCLANEGKCPSCRAPEQEVKLRRNDAVLDIVATFEAARADMLKAATARTADEEGQRTPKRKLDDTDFEADARRRTNPIRSARSSSRTVVESAVHDDEIQDETFQPNDGPALDEGFARCPICQRIIKIAQINSHIDLCLNGAAEPPLMNAAKVIPQKSPPPVDRLPKLNYSLYKENALRKKLQELGIRFSGSKALMERRHTEWVNLWNANCDSSMRKSKRELLQDLDTWERTQGQGSSGLLSKPNGVDVMKKDFDGSGWASNHKDDFKALILNARKQRSKPPDSENTEAEATPASHAIQIMSSQESAS